jgi:hypothetical protein
MSPPVVYRHRPFARHWGTGVFEYQCMITPQWWVIDNIMWTNFWPSIAGVGCGFVCVVEGEEKARKVVARVALGLVRGTWWTMGSSVVCKVQKEQDDVVYRELMHQWCPGSWTRQDRVDCPGTESEMLDVLEDWHGEAMPSTWGLLVWPQNQPMTVSQFGPQNWARGWRTD